MAKARRRRPSHAPSTGAGGAGREHWRAEGQAKTRFSTEDEANRAALQLRLEAGADLDPYACTWCGGWHLGNRGTRGTTPGDRRQKGAGGR